MLEWSPAYRMPFPNNVVQKYGTEFIATCRFSILKPAIRPVLNHKHIFYTRFTFSGSNTETVITWYHELVPTASVQY